MKKSEINLAKGIVWDLSSLYSGFADPEIAKDKSWTKSTSEDFTKKYKTKIALGTLTAQAMQKILEEYEAILNKVYILQSYAGLLQSKDTSSDKTNHFYQQIQEFSNTIQNTLMFFELEILELPEKSAQKYLQDEELRRYQQFFQRVRKFKRFTLKEEQEIILSKKQQTSSNAFVRLYDQLSAELEFELEFNGKTNKYNYSEITNILSSHNDRGVREQAAQAITEVYKKNSNTFGFILNTLLLDKKISDEIRNYDFPQQATFLSDEITKDTVDAMTSAIESNYSISEKFYRAKSEIVGHKLHEWDRYSLLFPDVQEPTYNYDQAKELILEAFNGFSPLFAEIADMFFHKNWIDAELSKGKKSGAFCSYTVPGKHPYILTNYTGKANDVRTLAHELGHGIHAYLSREQNILNFWPVTPFAEIASIFCENIVFRKIYEETSDPKQKLNLLGGRLQEIFATIFRQNAFYLFESEIHEKRRTKGELSVTELNEMFQSRLQQMFGGSLTLTPGHKYWWVAIAHFYHYNFYVFSYAFGQSLSNALYSAYINDGEEFISNYSNVLRMGSVKELTELTKMLGVDIHKKTFWEEGLEPISEYVEDFIGLSK